MTSLAVGSSEVPPKRHLHLSHGGMSSGEEGWEIFINLHLLFLLLECGCFGSFLSSSVILWQDTKKDA